MKFKELGQLILRQNSIWRQGLIFIVLVIGISQTLLSSHFFLLFNAANQANSDKHSEYFISISKPINLLSSLQGEDKGGFTEAELSEIGKQEFVDQVGEFKASNFRIIAEASLGKGSQDLKTLLFLESLPSSFLDIDTNKMTWKKGDKVVPVVIPRSYLTLYNFGFAQSQGLPQVTESVIKMLIFRLKMSGSLNNRSMKAQIVGFSDRINTLLAPRSFINWANEYFGSIEDNKKPARLMIKLKNPLDKNISTFLTEKGYQTSKSDAAKASMTGIINYSSLYVWLNGLIVCILSIIVLLLVIYLSISNNKTDIEHLYMLGYTVGRISLPYQLLAIVNVIFSTVVSLPISLSLIGMLTKQVDQLAVHNTTALQGELVLVALLSIGVLGFLIWFLLRLRISRIVK